MEREREDHSREQGDELGGLREDGDIVLRGLARDSGFRLLGVWAVVWADSLSRSRGWLAALVRLVVGRHREACPGVEGGVRLRWCVCCGVFDIGCFMRARLQSG